MDFTETPGAEDLMMELWRVIDNRNPTLTEEQVAEILAWYRFYWCSICYCGCRHSVL